MASGKCVKKVCAVDVDANCATCNAAITECTACKADYIFGDDGMCRMQTCTDLDSNCESCEASDATICAACTSGFDLGDDFKVGSAAAAALLLPRPCPRCVPPQC